MSLPSTSSGLPTVEVIGLPLAATDYAGAVATVKDWTGCPSTPRLVAFANTHVVTLARRDPAFRTALADFDLILPDGMPLVWAMNRKLAEPLCDRVYGPTFLLHCLAATQGAPWKHAFVGGSEEMLADLRSRLLTRFPDLQISLTYAPPFGQWPAEEDERIITAIRESEAQFVWVGLGCPKQELWLARLRDRLPARCYLAVGAAFAFHAGRVAQAPLWMQSRGLEWIFRLITEPRRLWRRYLIFNSWFVFYWLKDRVVKPSPAAR